MDILTVNEVTKRYKRVTALQDISLSVPEGSVYGILGPNGSGKTTLLGIVTGVLKTTAGTFRFFDGLKPPHEQRKEMGVLLETPNFYPYLSARQNLAIVARIKGYSQAAITDALRQVDLLDRQHHVFKTYTLGMKQRLAIASTLLGSPRVLILDEPTNGLDPEGISEIRQIIKQLASEGRTVILASHLLDEVEKVCTRVAILREGILLAEGDIRGTLARGVGGNNTMELAAADTAMLTRVIRDLEGVIEVKETGEFVTITYLTGTLTPRQVNAHCFSCGVVLDRLVACDLDLESVFLELTNK